MDGVEDGVRWLRRFRSAVAILDRAWGRPRQAVEAAVAVTPTVITPEVDAGAVLASLAELGLITRPKKNGDGDY